MTILQEVLKWSKEIPTWQSDAVRRLLSSDDVTANDLDDLYALLKLEHGVADLNGRVPKPLMPDQIPETTQIDSKLQLIAIKNLQNVNAIAEGQRLPFAAEGMTVIYGDNGAGKTGYSRVLKRACRARDQLDSIYPNANLPSGNAGTSEAIFEISHDGVSSELKWMYGKPSPAELSAISIFDTRCAKAYLDSEDDFSYIPYGLHVFEGLAKICKQLKTKIDTEHSLSAPDLLPFSNLKGETAVGNLISNLSAKTSSDLIETLSKLTTEELNSHDQLARSLKQDNPKQKAIELRARSLRIEAIAKNAENKGALVDEVVVRKIQSLANAYRHAQAVSSAATKEFYESENLLPGTGGEAWKELFEAARKFVIESHNAEHFSELSLESPCPLCQQPLNEGTARLVRFENFIQQEAEKNVQTCRKALHVEYKLLDEAILSLNFDEVTFGEIENLDSPLATETRNFENYLLDRREKIKAAVISHDWTALAIVSANPANRLRALSSKLNAECLTLDNVADEAKRTLLIKQFAELESRKQLAAIKEQLLAALSKLVYQAKLTKCLSSVKTNGISLKSAELTEKMVSNELADALNREFKELGVSNLSVSLRSRSDKGKALHKLKLELPQSRSPAEILSEGEQRAIAIGTFLAEIGFANKTGGIVFDDPVSSLDHKRRERVAKRLALEAKKRQVIIFTHDIYFLCVLVEEAASTGVPILTQSLTKHVQGFGVIKSELPFEGMNTTKRIGVLKTQQTLIEKLFKDGADEDYRRETIDAYVHLRMAWERAVEEVLLRNVVLRFRKGIETNRLKDVSVEDSDYQQVYAGMAKCSNYAHDKASIGCVAVPEPDELLRDILELDKWRAAVEIRSQVTLKRRKSLA
ncbi:MAG: AAA family ATPase [Undibacterium umbellatum]|uniref:AAA family ATPase n=1 Tax=Undibacterium umbellatum TaxID=2762300 RepID=UPI003BB77495